jgi:hypothetical protein
MAFGSLALLKKTGSCGTRAKALKQSSLKSPDFSVLLSMAAGDESQNHVNLVTGCGYVQLAVL